jgi:hypothetical protein
MMSRTKGPEKGVALLFALLALLLISAIVATLVFMSTTETSVNYNYRSEQVAYFAGKAGIEEARDRMMASNSASIFANLPASVPPAAGGVLYILNEGNSAGSVKPWDITNAFVDDELCHDGYTVPGLQAQSSAAPGVRCTTVPSGTTWYSTVTSNAPWKGTSAALAYKWVRVTLKVNGSVQNYSVNGGQAATTPACWNGVSEKIAATTCAAMSPSANPVYLITSLGVSASGARKMVQAEVALTPSSPFPYGMYATATGCGALTLSGGATTDSFDSSKGSYVATKNQNQGDVGTNGNVTLNGSTTKVGGSIAYQNFPADNCPAGGYTTTGGAGMVGGQTPPNTQIVLSAPFTFATPPAPNPPPPTTTVSYKKNGANLVPGTYGSIAQTAGGILTLAPGVYNINSLTLLGNATLAVSPPGQVVLNVAGQGGGTVVDLTGGSISNTSLIANNFQINYAGTGTIALAGGANSYVVVNAPNAAITLHGGTDFYGAIVGSTINDQGGVTFHFDRNDKLAPPSDGRYNLISFREIAY